MKEVSGHVPNIPEILYCGEGETQFLIISREIAKATGRDPILSKVLWHIKRKETDLPDKSDHFKPYNTRVNELSVNGQCLLWGTRVIIPEIFRSRMLDILHEVHQGMSAMKSTARSYFRWPGLDKDIEMIANKVKNFPSIINTLQLRNQNHGLQHLDRGQDFTSIMPVRSWG